MSDTSAPPLKRDAYVWTLYMLLGLFSFMLSMIGPMVPYLRDEFSMSYTLAGLHQSAFALGMVTMGFGASRVLRRFGLVRSLWGGIADMLLGLLVMVSARGQTFGPYMTLGGIFIMSLGGTVLLTAIQTAFAAGPSAHRARLILESNVIASVLMMMVPLVLLAGARWFLGWRIVFPVVVIILGATAFFGIPATKSHGDPHGAAGPQGGAGLGSGYWRMWAVVFFGVSVEWAISFWCMTYLTGVPGSSRDLAATGTILLGFSMVAGRFTAGVVSSRLREKTMLLASIGFVLAGFPLYRLGLNLPLTLTGLALAGFGAANFYPVAVSMALGHAPGATARASSLIPVASGSAIGLAPFLLGRLADLTDLQSALWYIPIGTVLMLALLAGDRPAR